MKVTIKGSSRVRSILTVIFSALAAPVASAQDIIKDAFQVELSSKDFQTTLSNLSKTLSQKTISGTIPKVISTKILRVPVKFSQISYDFRIKNIVGTFRNGQIEIDADLTDFLATIGNVSIWSDSYACQNIPISSLTGKIPLQIVASPRVTDEGLMEVEINSFKLNLGSDNFNVSYPEKCDLVRGLNTIVTYALPYVARILSSTIESRLSETVRTQAAEFSKSFAHALNFEIGLPFNLKPLRPFFLTLKTRPTSLTLTPNRFAFGIGLGVKIETDENSLAKNFTKNFAGEDETSSVGLQNSFINYIISEVNRAQLFSNAVIDGKSTGADPAYFTVDFIGDFLLAKIKAVADVNAPFVFKISNLGNITTAFENNTTGSKLVLQIKNFKIDMFTVPRGSQALMRYGTMVVGIDAPLDFNLDEKESLAQINIAKFKVTQEASLELNTDFPGLDGDHKLRTNSVESLVNQLNEALKDPAKNTLIKAKIPPINVGTQQVRFKQIVSENEFFKLKFAIE